MKIVNKVDDVTPFEQPMNKELELYTTVSAEWSIHNAREAACEKTSSFKDRDALCDI